MKRLVFVCLLLSSLGAMNARAQSLSISGTVTDDAGAVPQASVTLKVSGQILVRETGTDGKYSFDSLNSGVYNISIVKAGYDGVESLVTLNSDSQVFDAKLKVGAISTTIVVTDVAGKATASRMGILDSEMPVQVSTIPQSVLQTQGINDMVTALRNASGVQAQRFYGAYEYYTVRGFNSSDLLVVDGMRFEGNRFNTQLNNVQQVDVLKGPSSFLYGGSALGGVVNIIRKKPEGVRAYDFMVRGGRFGTGVVAGGATGPLIENKLLYRVDASYDYSNGWRNAGARRFNISPSLTWLISPRNRVTIHESLNRDNFDGDGGLPLGLVNKQDYSLDARFSTPYDRVLNHDSQTHVLFNSSLTPNVEFRNSFFYRHSLDDYFVTEGIYYTPGDTTVDREAYGFRHNHRPIQDQADVVGRARIFGMDHMLMAGYEYRDFYRFTDWATEDAVIPLPPMNIFTFQETSGPPDLSTNNRRFSNDRIHALYWQDQISVTQNLKINVGGRYDDYRRVTRVDPWNNTGAPVSRGDESTLNQGAYTYRAGIVYKLPKNQQIYFSSASSFQPVTRVNNPPLDPEKGQNFEGGYRIQTRRWYTSAAIYHLTRQNVVVPVAVGRVEQAGQQSSKGIDIDVNGDLGRGLRLMTNYGYTVPKFDKFLTSNGMVDLSGKLPRYTQKHAVNVWLSKTFGESLTTSAGLRYLGPMFTNNSNSIQLGGWTTFSGAVNYRLGNWSLGLNAENLLNRQRYFMGSDYDDQVYPGAPINVFATLRFQFRP